MKKRNTIIRQKTAISQLSKSISFLRIAVFIVVSTVIFVQCDSASTSTEQTPDYLKISGKTMGTTYSIIYQDLHQKNYKPQIDSILVAINQEVSTYIEDSDISLFNKKQDGKYVFKLKEKPHFHANLMASRPIFEKTGGHFDPTVMPLVNYWGFGYTEKRTINKADEAKIDTILKSVGFDNIQVTINNEDVEVLKQNPKTELDFSAIAKGYAVDVIGTFLVSNHVEHFFIEIGGETFCKGRSKRGDEWALGINTPSKDAKLTDIEQIVRLTNKGLATSGNYRNYHQAEDGSIYAHTINPKTGFPEKSNLLSATVVAKDCMTADAFATAFMVMGKDKAIEMARTLPEIDIFLIYGNEKGEMLTYSSEGFLKFIEH